MSDAGGGAGSLPRGAAVDVLRWETNRSSRFGTLRITRPRGGIGILQRNLIDNPFRRPQIPAVIASERRSFRVFGGTVRRRELIKGIAGSVAAWPLAARAQQSERMRRIGVLMGYAESDRAAQSWLAAFRAAFTQLGWTEGSNLRIELRWSADDTDRMRTLAKELVDLRPDAILGATTPWSAPLPARRGQFRSCSRAYLIRLAAASLRILRIRAVTSLASCPTIRPAHWAENGWDQRATDQGRNRSAACATNPALRGAVVTVAANQNGDLRSTTADALDDMSEHARDVLPRHRVV